MVKLLNPQFQLPECWCSPRTERWFSSMCYSAMFFLSHPLGSFSLCAQLEDVRREPEKTQPLLKHLNWKVMHVLPVRKSPQKLIAGFPPGEQGIWKMELLPGKLLCRKGSLLWKYGGQCGHRCTQWAKYCLTDSQETFPQVVARDLRPEYWAALSRRMCRKDVPDEVLHDRKARQFHAESMLLHCVVGSFEGHIRSWEWRASMSLEQHPIFSFSIPFPSAFSLTVSRSSQTIVFNLAHSWS